MANGWKVDMPRKYKISTAICIVCNKSFHIKAPNAKMCSKECKLANKRKCNKENRVGYKEKKCAICYAIFKPNNSNAKICKSDNCVVVFKRQRKNKLQKGYHERNKKNPNYLFKRFLLAAISRILRKKTLRSSNYIDFNKEDFIEHIESKFKKGMCWENYGRWHIDHIKPLKLFVFINKDGSVNMEQIKFANSLENLQPLWASENCRKGAKYDH